MLNKKHLLLVSLGSLGLPSMANAYCSMPMISMTIGERPNEIAWSNYQLCVQQERQAEQHRSIAAQQQQQMELQRLEMERQRRQMEAQTREIQRQSRIQQQQLFLQQRQFEAQNQAKNPTPLYPPLSQKLIFISKIAEDYNKQLPMSLDDATMITHVGYNDSNLIINHKTSYEITTTKQVEFIKQIVTTRACIDNFTKFNINTHNITYIYRYVSPSGRANDIFLRPGDCK